MSRPSSKCHDIGLILSGSKLFSKFHDFWIRSNVSRELANFLSAECPLTPLLFTPFSLLFKTVSLNSYYLKLYYGRSFAAQCTFITKRCVQMDHKTASSLGLIRLPDLYIMQLRIYAPALMQHCMRGISG